MKRALLLFGVLYFFTAGILLNAQDGQNQRITPGLRRQALDISIESKVLENQVVLWSETHQKVTMQGSPVGVQLVGANIIVVVQFTPYIRNSGSVLAAQGQIWIAENNNELTYYTSIQTIPFELGEPIHFLPLGTEHSNLYIEIIISINPYNEDAVPRERVHSERGSSETTRPRNNR